MRNNEIINQINNILFDIQVKNEKLESYNILIDDKLENIENFEHNDSSIMLYNAKRYIEKYRLLSYSISDKINEVEEDIKKIYTLLDTLQNDEKAEI